jgi:hypothetical protein
MNRFAVSFILGCVTLAGCAGAPPTPTPAPTPIPTSVGAQEPAGQLQPGTYTAHPFAPADTLKATFTVPSNKWEALNFDQPGMVGVAWAGDSGGVGVGFMHVDSLNADPCKWSGAGDDIAVGPGVDDLAGALANSTFLETTTPIPTTVSGFSGKKLQITMLPAVFTPNDPADSSPCDQGNPAIWNGKGFDIYPQGVSNRWALTILDVAGKRVVILASDFAHSEPQRHQRFDPDRSIALTTSSNAMAPGPKGSGAFLFVRARNIGAWRC